MSTTFKEIRKLQGERVLMKFDDDREIVATLLCATKDIDGARHLIFNQVELGANAEPTPCACSYADAKTLVTIEHADAGKRISAGRGSSHLAHPGPFGAQLAKALHPAR